MQTFAKYGFALVSAWVCQLDSLGNPFLDFGIENQIVQFVMVASAHAIIAHFDLTAFGVIGDRGIAKTHRIQIAGNPGGQSWALQGGLSEFGHGETGNAHYENSSTTLSIDNQYPQNP
jgi:hypothetical protein